MGQSRGQGPGHDVQRMQLGSDLASLSIYLQVEFFSELLFPTEITRGSNPRMFRMRRLLQATKRPLPTQDDSA